MTSVADLMEERLAWAQNLQEESSKVLTGGSSMSLSAAMSAFDGWADPILLVDRQGELVYLNRAGASAFGLVADEARGRAVAELRELDMDEGLATLLKCVQKEAKPASLAAAHIGGQLWDVRLIPVQGDLVGIYCIPQSAFQASWPGWIADSADAIWALDQDDRIIAWNRGAEDLLGYTAEEAIGQPLARLIPPDLIEQREPERLRKALQELGAVRDYQTRRLTKDGREVEVSLTRTLTRNGSGEVASSTIVRDLSQRRLVERQLIESEKLVTLGQLAASVAQEIGAPLTAIALTVENLKARCRAEGHGVEKQLETILQQLDRIARLTHGLVELAKPGELKMTRVQVSGVITNALELLEPSLARARVSVEVDDKSENLGINADQGQLQQVFLNLFLNAQRALQINGGGRVSVKIVQRPGLPSEGHPLRDEVRIQVSDDGPGIDGADIPYIFAPFFSRFGGSGLGLALARQIILAHGGTIDVSSASGEGATFTVHLPVETDA